MKANELMIGDWVRCTDPKPFRIEQIDGVEEQAYGDDGFYVDTADLQPIPLTDEILEKNFSSTDEVGWNAGGEGSLPIDGRGGGRADRRADHADGRQPGR